MLFNYTKSPSILDKHDGTLIASIGSQDRSSLIQITALVKSVHAYPLTITQFYAICHASVCCSNHAQLCPVKTILVIRDAHVSTLGENGSCSLTVLCQLAPIVHVIWCFEPVVSCAANTTPWLSNTASTAHSMLLAYNDSVAPGY